MNSAISLKTVNLRIIIFKIMPRKGSRKSTLSPLSDPKSISNKQWNLQIYLPVIVTKQPPFPFSVLMHLSVLQWHSYVQFCGLQNGPTWIYQHWRINQKSNSFKSKQSLQTKSCLCLCFCTPHYCVFLCELRACGLTDVFLMSGWKRAWTERIYRNWRRGEATTALCAWVVVSISYTFHFITG